MNGNNFSELGTYEICFYNHKQVVQLVTHVTHTLQSQHPVHKGTLSLKFILATFLIVYNILHSII